MTIYPNEYIRSSYCIMMQGNFHHSQQRMCVTVPELFKGPVSDCCGSPHGATYREMKVVQSKDLE